MTTAAMALAVVPLIIAEGAGAAARYAMGLVIFTGLIDRHAASRSSWCRCSTPYISPARPRRLAGHEPGAELHHA